MKIALAQLNQVVADLEGNARRIEEAYRRAVAQGAELVVFSELALCGYPPLDLLDRQDFLRSNRVMLSELANRLQPVPALLGCALENSRSRGKRAYNAAVLLEGGRRGAWVAKSRLPTYDVFDEARYFEPGGRRKPLQVNGLRLGVTICEDIWEGPEGRQLYRRDPVGELAAAGVDLLVNLSASPFEIGKANAREQLLAQVATRCKAPALLVNQVGGNDQLLFDGRSLAVDVQGRLLARARAFAEELLLVEIPGGGPVGLSPQGEEELLLALVMGLRDFFSKCNFTRAVLGLSGGVDSAVCAVLATRALGAENVEALAMPSRYSSPISREDASELARNLGIACHVVPIDSVLQTYREVLEPVTGPLTETLVEENLQARIRGALVMAFANHRRALAIATGNKSELATGYCTLYGDMVGAIAPIGDLLKTQVYALAHFVNRERQIIPRRTLERPPSAELRPGQIDEDSLPAYAELDPLLEAHIGRGLGGGQLLAEGFPPQLVERVLGLVQASEFKRQQAAPVLRVTRQAFGSGRRVPIARGGGRR